MNMLEHQKKVLEAVSGNYLLFEKELRKSFKWLNDNEIKELNDWLKERFYHQFPHIIDNLFSSELDYAS